MSNILKESMIETIKELGQRGWSIRRIAKELEINPSFSNAYLKIEKNDFFWHI